MTDHIEAIRIFDTTLRDGEQSPGCSMNLVEKLALARQLEKLGVTADEAAGVLGENLARFTGSFPNGPRKQLIHRSTSATF